MDKPEPIVVSVGDGIASEAVIFDQKEVEAREILHDVEFPKKNSDAIIIQSCVPTHGPFDEALEWLKPIHSAYAEKWNMDYLANSGLVIETKDEQFSHAWDKIILIWEAAARGYEYIFWIDHDCVIVDFSTDLRAACYNPDKGVYMCVHPGFPMHGLPSHFNAGVMAVRGGTKTEEFFQLVWEHRYSGPPWFEQDVMNGLFREFAWMDYVEVMQDKFNSTPNANEVPIEMAVIAAFHGIGSFHDVNNRLDYMKKAAEIRNVEKQMARIERAS